MSVTYVNAERPRITRDEMRDKSCGRRLNGLAAVDENCCTSCRSVILSTKPIEYRVRDSSGHIITADWVMWLCMYSYEMVRWCRVCEDYQRVRVMVGDGTCVDTVCTSCDTQSVVPRFG